VPQKKEIGYLANGRKKLSKLDGIFENSPRLPFSDKILNTVRHGYNDIDLYDTSYITSDILRYQLILHG
jgi:hypothetical protein